MKKKTLMAIASFLGTVLATAFISCKDDDEPEKGTDTEEPRFEGYTVHILSNQEFKVEVLRQWSEEQPTVKAVVRESPEGNGDGYHWCNPLDTIQNMVFADGNDSNYRSRKQYNLRLAYSTPNNVADTDEWMVKGIGDEHGNITRIIIAYND